MEDEEILAYFKNPSTRDYAFRQLMHKYQERLYRHVIRMVHFHEDTDDILQEVWIKVWRNMEGFKGNSQLYTWLYRIAMNETFTHLQNKKRQPSAQAEELRKTLTMTAPAEQGNISEAEKRLAAAIATLPERQKEVFNLRYFEEMPYEAISRLTGISIGALKASYHHALKKIEKILSAD